MAWSANAPSARASRKHAAETIRGGTPDTRACEPQPNWAAPAYVAGSLMAARLVLMRGWAWALPAQAAIGALAAGALWLAAWAYAAMPLDLPRIADPFKKMRIGEPFCAAALGQMAEEGAEILLSDDRRRLSECMFQGGLTFDEIKTGKTELAPVLELLKQ